MEYKIISQSKNGYAKFQSNNKFGILAPPIEHLGQNKRLVEPIYDQIYLSFKEEEDASFVEKDRYCVRKNNKFGYINGLGQEVIECQFDEADSFEDNNIAPVYNHIELTKHMGEEHELDELNLIDRFGNLLFPRKSITGIDIEVNFLGNGFIVISGMKIKNPYKYLNHSSDRLQFEPYIEKTVEVEEGYRREVFILQTTSSDIEVNKLGEIIDIDKIARWTKEWLRRKAVKTSQKAIKYSVDFISLSK